MITRDKAQRQIRENESSSELNKPVRVHADLCAYSWARLWYFCRGIDENNRGTVIISLPKTLKLFGCGRSTFYRWLRTGEEAGAFQFYHQYKGSPRIYIRLGGRNRICMRLGLDDWGPTRLLPLAEVIKPGLYKQASIIRALDNQRKSRRAAIFGLSKEDRKLGRRILRPEAFYRWAKSAGASYQNLSAKTLKETFHIKKIVGETARHFFCLTRLCFVPIGGSQQKIGTQIGRTERTVRNHLEGIDRVQLCHPVPKRVYDAEVFYAAEANEPPKVFKAGNQAFRYGCNVYDLDFNFKSERVARLKFEYLKFRQKHFSQKCLKKSAGRTVHKYHSPVSEKDRSLRVKAKSFKLKAFGIEVKVKLEIESLHSFRGFNFNVFSDLVQREIKLFRRTQRKKQQAAHARKAKARC